MADLCSQLCTVVGEIDCDPKGKAVPVLKPGHAVKGNLLTDDVDIRCISGLQRQTALRARHHVYSLKLAAACNILLLLLLLLTCHVSRLTA